METRFLPPPHAAAMPIAHEDGHFAGYPLNESISGIAKQIGEWASRTVVQVSSELSRLACSAEGLSDGLRVALLSHAFIKTIQAHTERAELEVVKQIDNYRTIVNATRLLTNPSYFLGNDLQEDIRKERWFGIASSVMWTAVNAVAAFELTFDSMLCEISQKAKTLSKDPAFVAFRAGLNQVVGGVVFFAFVSGTIEIARDMYRGEGDWKYNVVRGCANTFDALATACDILPVPVTPLFKASCGLAAASCGLAAFFLDPKS